MNPIPLKTIAIAIRILAYDASDAEFADFAPRGCKRHTCAPGTLVDRTVSEIYTNSGGRLFRQLGIKVCLGTL